jgi:hypothetical protein
VIWGARKRVRTRHIHFVVVLGSPAMAEFALWPAGAPGDSALSTHPCGVFLCAAGMYCGEFSLCKYILQIPLWWAGRGVVLCKVVPQVLGRCSTSNIELPLLCAIAHPLKYHIYCFATLLLTCTV